MRSSSSAQMERKFPALVARAGILGNATRVICTPASPLARGAYNVFWLVTSKDTHVVHGAFAFGVGVAVGRIPATPDYPYDPSGLPANVFRWLSLLGAALIVGALTFETFVLRAGAFPEEAGPAVVSLIPELRVVTPGWLVHYRLWQYPRARRSSRCCDGLRPYERPSVAAHRDRGVDVGTGVACPHVRSCRHRAPDVARTPISRVPRTVCPFCFFLQRERTRGRELCDAPGRLDTHA